MNAILFILFGAGAAALAMYLITRRRDQAAQAAKAREDALSNANVTNDITQVREGGVLKLPPFGAQRAPIETYVKARHRYEDPEGHVWYELVCEHGRRELLLEWAKYGRVIDLTGGFEDENPTLEALGLDEDALIRIDEDQKGEFEWDGVHWRLEESRESFFFEADGAAREGYYGWCFEAADRRRFISIEKWEGERHFTVYHLWLIDAQAVEVYEAGGART
ncbi:DUF4178 domain-containing protein [Myxococcota bacterium]|nr:DUF4178 domain-containing protein [Myxococcota bacterium]MBU1428982.1 DUF4178 domain-containing protein [Myxococcota bacterium]MBU1897642.1 DUF4178 domain-containing protein [Myxococcota bacterium]